MREILSRFRRAILAPPALIAIAVLLATAIRAALPSSAPVDAAPRVVVLDVGQGDAILLDGPGDAEVLIDGGPTTDLPRQLSRHLGRDRSIDLVILTHPHADHLVGLAPVLEYYDVGRVVLTGAIHTTREYERFLTVLRDRRIPTTVAVAGQVHDVGPFHLDVLSPFEDLTGKRVENLNSSSVVMMVSIAAASRATRLLLPGDAESDVEVALLERSCANRNPDAPCPMLRADVLKVSHHGSQDSSSSAFLDAVAPAHAIISVGRKNDYHHPHPRALKRLERVGARIWRTDRQGDITVTFSPEGLSVTSQR